MRKHSTPTVFSDRGRAAFTLIEVMVVVAILGLLAAILMPSLSKARKETMAIQCATNLHHVHQAVHLYVMQHDYYPVSYAYRNYYPSSKRYVVDLSPDGQEAVLDNPYGYVHWSYMLYEDGKVDDAAFECPAFENGGAPRTNPGSDSADWEAGQVDDDGQTGPGSLNIKKDWQAKRMALTANAAIMPRNKFTRALASREANNQTTFRVNQLVRESAVRRASETILITEFNNNWETLTKQAYGGGSGDGLVCKSHRPLNPFMTTLLSSQEYAMPNLPANRPCFLYEDYTRGDSQDPLMKYGIMNYEEFKVMTSFLTLQENQSELNAVGRHHPGGEEYFGGTANFVYADGHVDRKTVLDTVMKREWGDAYYSLSGNNTVHDYEQYVSANQ